MTQKATERKEKENSNSLCVCVWVCEALEAGSLDITKSPQSACKSGMWKRDSDSKELCIPTPSCEVPLVTKKPLVCTAT